MPAIVISFPVGLPESIVPVKHSGQDISQRKKSGGCQSSNGGIFMRMLSMHIGPINSESDSEIDFRRRVRLGRPAV